jgi:SnoaL-like domain
MPSAAEPAAGALRDIEADCQRVVLSVFRHLDDFAYRRLIEHFATDGTWHREGRELAGRETILAALEQRPRNQVVRHVVTNLIVDVESPSRARASGYNTAFRALDTSPADLPVTIAAPLGLWVLDATLARQGDAWLIAELRQAKQFSFG